jgi:hypothetical protein
MSLRMTDWLRHTLGINSPIGASALGSPRRKRSRTCTAAALGRNAGPSTRHASFGPILRGSPTETEALYFVLPVPNREPREDELKAMCGRRSRLREGRGSEGD